MNSNIPAGWYPNPSPDRMGTVKWWDGDAWTECEQTDFSNVDVTRISKREARSLIVQMQQSIHNLEDIISRHGLRQYEDFTCWRQTRIDALDKYHVDVTAEATKIDDARRTAQVELDELNREIVAVRGVKDFQDVGYFDFEHPAEISTQLATELEAVRAQIKNMIRDKTASSSVSGFTFNNSAAQGKKFLTSLSKLLLRAYNAEAENAIKATKAGNLNNAQARLSRAADQIAKNGSMINLRISDEFHEFRLKEIELAHRHMNALGREKELERERRAELREQRKAELELAKEQERLEKEKSHYQATLAVLTAKGDEEGVSRMLAKLEDVERAISDVDYRAANIRAGYVYVISNVGSFGPDVVKIGMTRRLEPMDRVRELGDASVPFRFDVHALFFADDAVTVESLLHKEFSQSRINQVNLRREYFQTTPQAVLEKLREHKVEVLEFRIQPDAEEFNESLAIRNQFSALAPG